MNQILNVPFQKSKTTFFKLQFLISNLVILSIIIYLFFNYFFIFKEEQKSNQLLNSYNISKLYNNSKSNLFGMIKIPKIAVHYPVFSTLDDELLKVSPCKFYGGNPNNFGNICIAGHNYNNNLFFGNIPNLNYNDEIFLFDNKGQQYIYYVFSVYEVSPSNLSPVFEYSSTERVLTLITCNNLNNKRIIVKAKQKDF